MSRASVLKKHNAKVPECTSCGACCRPEPDIAGTGYVYLFLKDIVALTKAWKKYVVEHARSGIASTYFGTKITASGERRCVALVGKVGEKVRCAIYDKRPEMCSTFKRGGRECLEALEEAGIAGTSARLHLKVLQAELGFTTKRRA